MIPAKTLLGYADRISVAPGETIAFKASSENGKPYEANIVRLINGDVNPDGPGFREDIVEGAGWRVAGRRQIARAGSCAVVPEIGRALGGEGFALELLVWPTTPSKPRQVLVSLGDAGDNLVRLELGSNGIKLLRGEAVSVAVPAKIIGRIWYRVRVRVDASLGLASCSVTTLPPALPFSAEREGAFAPGWTLPGEASLIFAAAPDGNGHFCSFFNGKLEAPALWRKDGSLAGQWDFAAEPWGASIEDVSGHDLHGRTHQRPARAVTGHAWSGEAQSWKQAPRHYGAIHFHDDDIDDAGWETDFEWRVPRGLRSGLYAARLWNTDDEDYIPFVLKSDTPDVPLVLVIPTASYQAYANEHLAFDAALAELVHDHVPVFGPNDLYLAAHRELGGSLYDRHSDGSGIYTSSRRRPILNMRPKYQSWLGGTGSGLWQLNADTHLIAWLEHEGIKFDCITDEDLDRDGVAALEPYECVMLATHAEYWSTRMRDALDGFIAAGGRVMNMGANCLYWRVVYDPAGSGTIELRRAEVGNGWITPPGESYHAFNGEYGGLWRRIGRAPQTSVGVGFIGQGFDLSSYYRRLPGSWDARAGFIFENVTDEILGDFGLIGGGAAGIELDRTDVLQGTPPHALVLARSEAHTANYLVTVEELLINYVNQAEISPVCGEMVFFETASGGAVFSTGSIAWAGSLSHDSYRNNIAAVSANVLRRFLDPQPFALPEIA